MDSLEFKHPGVETPSSKELGLKFSGSTLPSPDHPNRNDDAIAVHKDHRFAIVCDGMGGLPDGNKASRAARDFVAGKLTTINSNTPSTTAAEIIRSTLIEASEEVSNRVLTPVIRAGKMVNEPLAATTLTAVKFLTGAEGQSKILIGHVGDTRCYILRRGQLIQVTEDDRAFGTQNQLTNYLGRNNTPTPQIYEGDIADGDKIILASDGIECLSPQEIIQIIKDNPENPAEALTQKAYAKFSQPGIRKDDVSAIVIEANSKHTQKLTEHQYLLKGFDSIVNQPLDPETPRKIVATIIKLASSEELSYKDAKNILNKFSDSFSLTSIRDALQNPQIKNAFFEARKTISRLTQMAYILEDFKEKALTDGENFFNVGKRGLYNWINGSDPPIHDPEADETKRKISEFNQEDKNLKLMNNIRSKFPNITFGGAPGGWIKIGSMNTALKTTIKNSTEGKTQVSADAGRIYLNVKSEGLDNILYNLAGILNNHPDVPFEAKMIEHGKMTGNSLNRADKMVLYFDPKDQATILRVVQELYKNKHGLFDTDTPKFSAKLRDPSGMIMKGVAFGQEPSDQLDWAYTFNNIRETILWNMKDSLNLSDEEFDDRLRKMMREEYYVDPTNPAFNYPPEKGKLLYPTILANAA